MGKKLILDETWAAAAAGWSRGLGRSCGHSAHWAWSDVGKAAGAGLAIYVIGSVVNGQIKVGDPGSVFSGSLNDSILQNCLHLAHDPDSRDSETAFQKRKAYAKIEAHMATVDRRKEELRRRLADASGAGQLVTAERREILALDIAELAERLKQGTLKPTAVLEAYQVTRGELTTE